MRKLVEQLEEAKRLQDEGLVALISAQLFYLRSYNQEMPEEVRPFTGKRAELLKKFGVPKK